ncbi:MAG TPA: aldehyde dehydrogenase family protein, partial [Pirellulaceae bacterium]|nr:aldehyde dehydrogenase family protein [Pirellulaceae bacterium]
MNHQHPILIGDRWVESAGTATFHATNPATSEPLPDWYPVSVWQDCEQILDTAQQAFTELQEIPAEQLAEFLTSYAALLNSDADAICQTAALETGLAVSPRLKDVELLRTMSQLRQASAALLDGSWRMATIDTQYHLRSMYRGLGPVVVFGPNNFPLAFNAIAGGDFAAAIAAGNPVIAKAHPLHPSTTRLMAELAAQAASATRLPPGTIQLIYHLEREDGLRLVADRRVGAVGFTGSRHGGLALKS